MGGKSHRSAGGDEVERAITAAAEASSLAELGTHVLPHLERAMGASATLLYRYDEAGRLAPLAGALTACMDQYAHHYLHLDPVQIFPRRLAPQPRVVLATRHVDRRLHHHSAAYGEFYSTFELEHLACAWLTHLPYGAPGMTGMLFARPPNGDDFGEADQRLLGRALPALAAAAARADRLADLDLQRQALEAIIGASNGPARLVLTPDGQVIWASPAGERLLSTAPGAWLAAVRSAARRLHGSPAAPSHPTLPILTDGKSRQVYLSRLRTSSGAPLVLAEIEGAPAAPPAGAELARRFELTPAEGTVLRHLAEGLGNQAIAARLHVSIETVRTHVKHLLGKLGVRSRVEAALLVARNPSGARR